MFIQKLIQKYESANELIGPKVAISTFVDRKLLNFFYRDLKTKFEIFIETKNLLNLKKLRLYKKF
jgi:hypothetical protein